LKAQPRAVCSHLFISIIANNVVLSKASLVGNGSIIHHHTTNTQNKNSINNKENDPFSSMIQSEALPEENLPLLGWLPPLEGVGVE